MSLNRDIQRPGSMPLLSEGEGAPPQNCHRLVILGSARVGKTSVITRFLTNKYEEKYTPTIEDFHRKVYRIKGEAHRLDILDTSGNHPFPAMRRLSLLTGRKSAYMCNGVCANFICALAISIVIVRSYINPTTDSVT